MKRVIEYLLACMGTATVAALARFCLADGDVATGYAVITMAVLVVAWRTHLEIFLYQALIMLGVAAFRISMTNFYSLRTALPAGAAGRWSTVAAILLLLAGVVFAYRVRAPKSENASQRKWYALLVDRPEQPMFFVPVALMGFFLYIEVHDKLALAWGVEGVVVFILALIAKERSFRLTGLGLLMVGVVMILWDLLRPGTSTTTRYITLIALGAMLLAVSFLYGRFRETLREYL
jgi:cbb3-type cytochrome oxidase subunit 3